jgi:hypothetical protein
MVRIEFIKGQGGVANIINGNLRDVDRNALLDIEAIDRVIVAFHMAIAINEALKAFEISGYIIVFDSLEAMKPYLDQINMLDGEVFNPGINGVKKPSWDVASRDKTEGIVSHSYENTDIEQTLINNG